MHKTIKSISHTAFLFFIGLSFWIILLILLLRQDRMETAKKVCCKIMSYISKFSVAYNLMQCFF